jgi:hypothetical protein
MPKQWRMRSAAEQWRREQRRAEQIAAEIKAGTADREDVAWLKDWKARQSWNQGVQASRADRAHRESRQLDARKARGRDP